MKIGHVDPHHVRTLRKDNMANECGFGVLENFDLQHKNNNILPTTESKEKPDKQTKDEAFANAIDLSGKVEKLTKLNGFSKPQTPPSTSPVRAVLRSVVDKKQAVQNLEINKQLTDEEW